MFIPTTIVVAVVVDGFIVGKFGFHLLGSHCWYQPGSLFRSKMSNFLEQNGGTCNT